MDHVIKQEGSFLYCGDVLVELWRLGIVVIRPFLTDGWQGSWLRGKPARERGCPKLCYSSATGEGLTVMIPVNRLSLYSPKM